MLEPIRGRARAQQRNGSSVVLPQEPFELRHGAVYFHKPSHLFHEQPSMSEDLVLQEL